MRGRWGCDHHRVDAAIGKKRVDGRTALRAELARDALRQRRVGVMDSEKLRATDARDVLGVTAAHQADADHTDADVADPRHAASTSVRYARLRFASRSGAAIGLTPSRTSCSTMSQPP